MSEIVISIIVVIVALVATIIIYLLTSRPTVVPPPAPAPPPLLVLPSQIIQTLEYPSISSSKISDRSVIVQTPGTLDSWFQYSGLVWSNRQIITQSVDTYDVSSDGTTLVTSKDNVVSVYKLSTSSYNLERTLTTPPGTVISKIKVNINGNTFMVLGQTGILTFNRIYRGNDNFIEYQLPLPGVIITNTFGDIAVSGNGAYVVVSLSSLFSSQISTVNVYKFNGVNFSLHSSFNVDPNIGFGNKIELDTDATRLISYDNSNSIYVYTRNGTNWSFVIIGTGIIGNIVDDGTVISGAISDTVNVYIRRNNLWQIGQSFQLTGAMSSDINNSNILIAQTPSRITIYGPGNESEND